MNHIGRIIFGVMALSFTALAGTILYLIPNILVAIPTIFVYAYSIGWLVVESRKLY